MGMGAFQLLRRSTYEAVGTHRCLAMEVVDDVKLGKLVKRAGFRSGVALSEERIRLRWQDGVGNIIRGLTKNSFAFHGYNPGVTLFLVVAVLALHVLPLVAVVFTSGLTRALAVVGTLTVMLFHAHTPPTTAAYRRSTGSPTPSELSSPATSCCAQWWSRSGAVAWSGATPFIPWKNCAKAWSSFSSGHGFSRAVENAVDQGL